MRFEYSADIYPAGLIIPVRISPLGTAPEREIKAKIDTGADISIIPQDIKRELQLQPRGVIWAKGAFDKDLKAHPTFFVALSINNIFFFEIEVISSERKDFLAGRDILNQIILYANGPEAFFELTKATIPNKR